MVSNEAGMISPVNGRAMRFVSRKCFGKVPKYRYARGPVVIWQEIDKAADSQIRKSGPFFSFPESGQKFLSHGKIYAIPAIAAYDS